MKANYKIAVLLTCFNRKDKTIKALESLFESSTAYNNRRENSISLTVFLTNDGCTDGTEEAVRNSFHDKDINIIQADGNAFWAGGMRIAWKEAYKSHELWEYYLLINDDVILTENAFDEMMACEKFALDHYNMKGIYTGFIADKDDYNIIIYGAKTYKRKFLSRTYDMQPTGEPQPCKFTNANFMCVNRSVVDRIGLLDNAYRHGGADWDYGMRASKAGIPVLTTPGICGYSKNDHDTIYHERDKVNNLSLRERREFLLKPQREYHDAFVFLKRYNKPKYLIIKVAYLLNLYTPRFYYFLSDLRP